MFCSRFVTLTVTGEQKEECFCASLDVEDVNDIKNEFHTICQHDEKCHQPNVMHRNCNGCAEVLQKSFFFRKNLELQQKNQSKPFHSEKRLQFQFNNESLCLLLWSQRPHLVFRAVNAN